MSIIDENRVNELVELSMKEFPDVDRYLLWLCAIDYVVKEEMKIDTIDDDIKEKINEMKLKCQNKEILESVVLKDENNNIL
jgi:hypothetical protein